MRILVINYEYPPLGGGGGVFSAQLATSWVKMGHQVEVVTSGSIGLKKKETAKGVKIYRVWAGKRKDLQSSRFLNLLWFIFSGSLLSFFLVLKNKYTFINTHFAIPTGIIGYFLQFFLRSKNVLTLHGADIYDPSRRMSGHRYWLTRKAISIFINKASYTIASTNEIKSKAQKYFKIKRRIKIIPLGYVLEELFKKDFTEKREHPNLLKLITIGRMVKRKNLELLIEAVENLREKVSLEIIGDGPLRKKLETKVKELKLEKVIKFSGRIAEEQKIKKLKKADIYISSALHEGFGIVFLEALQAGLPIIASDKGGQIYFLEEGKNALFFRSKNKEDLKRKINYFIGNKGEIKNFGIRNQELVKKFGIEKVAKEYLKLIR